jgi:hypothetical protein
MATQTINYDINVNAGGSLRTIQDIENELNELNQEIKEVGVGSAAFDKAAGNIQKLENELAQVNNTVEGFTLDKKLETADGAIKVVAGSVAGLTGAVGLLGIESEEFDKLTAQATNAIAFGMGIKDVSEGVGKLAKNLDMATISQKAYNVVQKIFNAIMSANPVAIVILSITTLIGLVVALKDKFEAVNKVFSFFKGLVTAVGEALGLTESAEEKAAREQKERYEQRILDIDNELKIRKAAGEETVELEREKLETILALTEEGSQEQKNALADLQAFEQQILTDKQNAVDAANEEARKKRQEEREARKAEEDAAAEEAAQAEVDRLASIDAIIADYVKRAEDDAAQTELEKIELEEQRKISELESLGAELADIQAVRDYYAGLKLEAESEAAAQAVDIAKKEAADKEAAAMAELEARTAIEQAKFGLLAQFGGLLGQLAGESKELQIAAVIATQAAAIGQIISATGLANAKALAASPLTFGQPWVTINTVSAGLSIASAVASAAKSISDIKNSDNSSAPAGPSTLPSSAPGRASTPNPNLNIGVSPETQVGQSSVRAYVVSGDITSNQEAEAKLSTRRAISG